MSKSAPIRKRAQATEEKLPPVPAENDRALARMLGIAFVVGVALWVVVFMVLL